MASAATYETLSASDHSAQLRKAVVASTRPLGKPLRRAAGVGWQRLATPRR